MHLVLNWFLVAGKSTHELIFGLTGKTEWTNSLYAAEETDFDIKLNYDCMSVTGSETSIQCIGMPQGLEYISWSFFIDTS